MQMASAIVKTATKTMMAADGVMVSVSFYVSSN